MLVYTFQRIRNWSELKCFFFVFFFNLENETSSLICSFLKMSFMCMNFMKVYRLKYGCVVMGKCFLCFYITFFFFGDDKDICPPFVANMNALCVVHVKMDGIWYSYQRYEYHILWHGRHCFVENMLKVCKCHFKKNILLYLQNSCSHDWAVLGKHMLNAFYQTKLTGKRYCWLKSPNDDHLHDGLQSSITLVYNNMFFTLIVICIWLFMQHTKANYWTPSSY